MTEAERFLRDRLASELRRRARELTRDWVEAVASRLAVDRREVLPTERLLDDVPHCLEAIADFLEAPESEVPDGLIRTHMDALVRLRRSQGFGVTELLKEYDLLAEYLQRFIEQTVADMEVVPEASRFAAVVGQVKEAFAQFGLETARSYRYWATRERRQRALKTTTFAAMVRHELRNRLGSAQTAAELLCEPGLAPERRQRLARLILRGLEQALETIDVVKSVLADEGIDTESIRTSWIRLDELVAFFTDGGTERNPRVEIDLHVDGGMRVPDPRVGMVMLNLVDNAVRYHRDDGDDRWVRITAEPADGNSRGSSWIRITVADNGPGIERALHDSLFGFAVRGDSGGDGSGIGLALSRDIVRQMGGALQLESEPGEGTRVSLTVPAQPERPAGDEPAAEKMDTDRGMR